MSQEMWNASAQGWIAGMRAGGDPTRVDVMDAPMLDALPQQGEVLDIGCGEGRFCRMMQARGLNTVGLDPTPALLAQAQSVDQEGHYVEARAEVLPFADNRFDAVVFYLSLIDIKGFRTAIAEAARVLAAGGKMIVANLHPHATARPADLTPKASSWLSRPNGAAVYMVDEMSRERDQTVAWGDVRIVNYHRPLSSYMQAFLNNNLSLTHFFDPPYTGGDEAIAKRWQRMPWAFQMIWKKMEITQ